MQNLTNDRLLYLRTKAEKSWTDYLDKSQYGEVNLSHFTKHEFIRFWLYLVNIDDAQQSLLFRCSIRTVQQVLRRAKRKFYNCEYSQRFFTSPFASEARMDSIENILPLMVEVPQHSKQKPPVSALVLKTKTVRNA